ncbi:MAG: hypothetical protein IPK72_11910 [Candidatus Eisenbacteria bacterium]|nr:hypothetical protein [Candidatus Eisenbacteria bacterium]
MALEPLDFEGERVRLAAEHLGQTRDHRQIGVLSPLERPIGQVEGHAIGRNVVGQDLAVAIEDPSPLGAEDLPIDSVLFRQGEEVIAAHHLEPGQATDQKEDRRRDQEREIARPFGARVRAEVTRH